MKNFDENEFLEYVENNIIIANFLGDVIEPFYYILEWTCDCANTSWWQLSLMKDEDITRGSDNEEDWHCEIKNRSTWTELYHSDWNQLMRVVNKIEAIEINNSRIVLYTNKNGNGWYAGFNDGYALDTEYFGEEVSGCKNKEEAVWFACVNFINYYNNLD